MAMAKSCPGSRAICEPKPEYFNCANCGTEVEIWTDELKATCPKCGSKVYRARGNSCIDWCPHAKECVGPEAYERLKGGAAEPDVETSSPLDVLKRDHERALDAVGLLRGAALCLKMGAQSPESPISERGLQHLTRVLEFFEKDLALHFRREEEVLFPVLEKNIGGDRSPMQLLAKEHQEVWDYYRHLKEKESALKNGTGQAPTVAGEVEAIAQHLGNLLPEHIKRENESLLPLASRLLSGEELEETARKIRNL